MIKVPTPVQDVASMAANFFAGHHGQLQNPSIDAALREVLTAMEHSRRLEIRGATA